VEDSFRKNKNTEEVKNVEHPQDETLEAAVAVGLRWLKKKENRIS
jgi:hypothetical protein